MLFRYKRYIIRQGLIKCFFLKDKTVEKPRKSERRKMTGGAGFLRPKVIFDMIKDKLIN